MIGCDFCKPEEKIGNRVIWPPKIEDIKDKDWYAFIPLEPEIFGHLIVTVKNPHIREIISDDTEIIEVLQRMNKGIKLMAEVLYRIKNVQRIYIAMLGETDPLHMHYHLLPRYYFKNESEIDKWAEKNQLKKGLIEWRNFYSRPTSRDGFQYFGEIEKSFSEAAKKIGKNPSNEILEEIARRLKGLIKKVSKNKGD